MFSYIEANRNYKSFILLLWMAIAPLIFSGSLAYWISENANLIEAPNSITVIVFFIAATFTMAVALTPTTFIAIVSGYFIGLEALPFLVAAYTIASYIGHIIAKPLGNNFHSTLQTSYPKIEALTKSVNKSSPILFVIFCRLSPVLPFAIMNIVLTYLKIPLQTFITGGIIGMLPRTLISIMVGNLAKDLLTIIDKPGQDHYMQLTFIVLFIVSTAGLTFYFKKILKQDR